MDECEWSLRRKVSCLSPFALAFRIADGLTLRRQQPSSRLIQIRQREQHVQLRGVLGQTPITHHHVSPLPLDYAKRKLNDRSQRRDDLILKPLLEGKFLASRGPMRGSQLDPRLARQRAIALTAIAAIAQDFVFLSMQQLLQQVDPQHSLQRHRTPTKPGLWIVRFDQRYPPRPRYDPIHLVETAPAAFASSRHIRDRQRSAASLFVPKIRWRYYAIELRDLIRVSLERALRRRQEAGCAWIALACHPQCARKRLEHGFRLVVRVVAAQIVDMDGRERVIDEALKEFVNEIDVERPDQRARERHV